MDTTGLKIPDLWGDLIEKLNHSHEIQLKTAKKLQRWIIFFIDFNISIKVRILLLYTTFQNIITQICRQIDGPPYDKVLQEKQVCYKPWTEVELLYAKLDELDVELQRQRESYKAKSEEISSRWQNVKNQQLMLQSAFKNLALYFQVRCTGEIE